MKRTWRKPQKKDEGKVFRMNMQIRVPEVFLINEEGENVGIVSIGQALKMAEDYGLDLVEVNPKATPPVAKILDYGQFKYEKEKQAHKAKVMQKKVETKSIRLTVRISLNDLGFKLEQAKAFLGKGHKVKVELVLKGREKQHPDKAVEIISKFVRDLMQVESFHVIKEQDLTRKGSGFIIILANKTT